jgi:hypothetical protein
MQAGIHGLGTTVASAYAGRSIPVITAVPAYTETGRVSAISTDQEVRAAIVGRIPLGRGPSRATSTAA